jgi:alcohol dehydrogenase class IV
MHTPVEVTERALATLRAAASDRVVALGGGSTIGLGKAFQRLDAAERAALLRALDRVMANVGRRQG